MTTCSNVECDNKTDNQYFDEERKLTLCDQCLKILENLEPVDMRWIEKEA